MFTPWVCVILVSTNRFADLPPDFWPLALEHNPHGAGLMFHDGRARHIWRARHCSLGELQDAIAAIPTGVKAALHLRASTNGALVDANVNPVLMGDASTLAVMHNGTLPDACADSTLSDTVRFVRNRLPAIIARHGGEWHHPKVLGAVQRFAGDVNRFVMLDANGRWAMLDDGLAFQIGQCWVSRPLARQWLAQCGIVFAQSDDIRYFARIGRAD